MYIYEFSELSWEKVCKVKSKHIGNDWYYCNINRSVMFSEHRSWVYAITVNGRIVKIGESGNPLGIEPAYSYDPLEWESQPLSSTKCRLGRYRKGGDSDYIVRESLRYETKNDRVEFYAYKCPETTVPISINGTEVTLKSQIHKQLEKALLDKIMQKDGEYPFLNTGRY
jgi:hypothetical protein